MSIIKAPTPACVVVQLEAWIIEKEMGVDVYRLRTASLANEIGPPMLCNLDDRRVVPGNHNVVVLSFTT